MSAQLLQAMLFDAASAACYGLAGLALLAAGYAVVDALTPGKLHELVWQRRNRSATIMLASSTLAMAWIVSAAIGAASAVLWLGLVSTLFYGLVGLALMAVSFFLMDLLTPGKLGELLVDDAAAGPHPAVWVTAATHIGVGLVVAAAISHL